MLKRIPLFFSVIHVLHPFHFLRSLHLFHLLHLSHHLPTLCPYLNLFRLRGLNPAIRRRFQSLVMGRNMRLICMRTVSKTCVQAFVRSMSVIVTTCWSIPEVSSRVKRWLLSGRHGMSASRYTVAEVECPFV